MADTGWISPGTGVSDSVVGDYAWSNPSNITSSDDSNAEVIGTYETGGAKDYLVKLVDETGSIVGDNKSSGSDVGYPEAYTSYGGSTDLWSGTWSDTDINDSDFGVVYQMTFLDFEVSPVTYSEYLKATNFGFSIPTGSTINGIEVRIEKMAEYVPGTDPPPPEEPTEGYPHALVDNIQIKIYYTEVTTISPFPSFKRI